MTRYFSQPQASTVLIPGEFADGYGWPHDKAPMVSEIVSVNTGILDAAGNAIMRAPNPLGFGRDNEW